MAANDGAIPNPRSSRSPPSRACLVLVAARGRVRDGQRRRLGVLDHQIGQCSPRRFQTSDQSFRLPRLDGCVCFVGDQRRRWRSRRSSVSRISNISNPAPTRLEHIASDLWCYVLLLALKSCLRNSGVSALLSSGEFGTRTSSLSDTLDLTFS